MIILLAIAKMLGKISNKQHQRIVICRQFKYNKLGMCITSELRDGPRLCG